MPTSCPDRILPACRRAILVSSTFRKYRTNLVTSTCQSEPRKKACGSRGSDCSATKCVRTRTRACWNCSIQPRPLRSSSLLQPGLLSGTYRCYWQPTYSHVSPSVTFHGLHNSLDKASFGNAPTCTNLHNSNNIKNAFRYVQNSHERTWDNDWIKLWINEGLFLLHLIHYATVFKLLITLHNLIHNFSTIHNLPDPVWKWI